MSASSHSISVWIERLRHDDPAAARVLWLRFYPRLLAVARRRLIGRPRRLADEEDAALSAWMDFDQAVKEGRFPSLEDRDSLWALLLTMTERKVQEHQRHEGRAKRGGGTVRGDSALPPEGGRDDAQPDEKVVFEDSLEGLLKDLGDEELRATALDRLHGYGNDEIAERQGCARATVERRMRLIRETWKWLLES